MCEIALAADSLPTVCLSFKYRLLPNKAQHAALARILEDQRQLYNAALQHRMDAWRGNGALDE
jgi:putative transposase